MNVFRACFVLNIICICVLIQPRYVSAQIIDAPAQPEEKTVTQATGDFDKSELAKGIKQTSWPSIPWPTITMPKISMPQLPPLWPSDSEDGSPALLQPFADGFSKVSSGSKKAWEGTKDLFSVFQPKDATNSPAPAPSKQQGSLWERLTTRKKTSEVPQTVGEFMKQPRLNP